MVLAQTPGVRIQRVNLGHAPPEGNLWGACLLHNFRSNYCGTIWPRQLLNLHTLELEGSDRLPCSVLNSDKYLSIHLLIPDRSISELARQAGHFVNQVLI